MAEDPEKLKESERRYSELLEAFLKTTEADNIEAEHTRIKNRTALMILELGSHTLILGLALGSLWLIHLILEALLGKDAKFFNLIPISWIIDVADLLVIGKFLWEIVRDFRRK